ncbi:MAG: DUF3465 domain-containing protein [Methylotenera sp.]|nr:DUF3465 domain-containing protein [Oligoflexia bacterium]
MKFELTKVAKLALALSLTLCTQLALAGNDVDPKCISNGQDIGINNAEVIHWKHTTKNQFLARAHVQGTVSKVFPDHSGHKHFEIKLDAGAGETLEIVYNLSFGKLPALAAGMPVEACGDYITSNAATSAYPASPDGAILHWLHGTGKGQGSGLATAHDAGYLEISDVIYGQ